MKCWAAPLLFLFSTCDYAVDRTTVCAKYMTPSGWSQSHRVEATVILGSELNLATRSVDHNSSSTYVVISWDKDETSIIEMDFPMLSAVPEEGIDKRGIKWGIAQSSSVCF